jgi:hypothetical protein
MERVGAEVESLRIYSSRDGGGKTEDIVTKGQPDHVIRTFRGYMDLLKYWRDEAAHGIASELSDDEAYASLMLLARLAGFAGDHFAPMLDD